MVLLKIALLLTCVFYNADAACEDTMSKQNSLIITNDKGRVIDKFTDCPTMYKKHPILCKGSEGKNNGRCCKYCKSKRSELKCVDDTLRTFNNKRCADYVKQDVCNCDDKKLMVRKHCCKSCKGKVCPKCRDYLSRMAYIEYTPAGGSKKIKLTSCRVLISKYLHLCKQQYGKTGGHCCESCSKQDLSCIDEGIKWKVENKHLSCAQYVAQDGCRCDTSKVKKTCCASCKKADCDPCQDTLGGNSYIDVTQANGVTTRITSCKVLVRKYLILCERYGKEGGQCCKSCSGKDLSCIDNTLKAYIVNGKRLTCAQFIKQDKCNCKRKDVMKSCCASCENKDLSNC